MGRRRGERKGDATQSKSLDAFYVYCIGERDALAPLLEGPLPEAIESGARIELAVSNDLAAIISAVPLAAYEEDALRARLADPTWTARRAMRHEKVVEHFASRVTVIPLRFATLYLQRAGIEQMIWQRQADLRTIIERLRGREEWGVNIYYDHAKLMEVITTISPRLRELSEQAASAPPGQSYLMRKKIDAMRADEARAEIKRVAEAIERELAAFTEGAARLRVLKGETAEQGEIGAKLAFLVAQSRFNEFRAAAERAAQEHSVSGFKLELTGPWPAYNFASDIERQNR